MEDLLALARLIAFAKREADDLNLTVVAPALEGALVDVVRELDMLGVP